MGTTVSNVNLAYYQEFLDILPILFQEEISIALADTEVFVDVRLSEELPLSSKIGQQVPAGGAVYKALKSGEVMIQQVPAEVYGVAFQSFAFPIKNRGEVIGVLVVGKSLRQKHELLEKAASLSDSLEQSTKAIDEITSASQFLSETNQEIAETAKITADKTKEIGKVIAFMKEVSKKINMLGVNAAITSAHAGQYSKGFEVISKEIRNLSSTTAASVSEIEVVLGDIRQSVDQFSNQLSSSLLSLNDQFAATEEVLASMEELSSAAKMMKELADTL
ncbi:methyl-accepting chemotaxis protein [Enterococcus italicus]|uniref:methyl-accepting chemotaxis protein n=1 Tax=Enterococcus italicus TaxID=246144 RepID=UPI0028AC75AB|nr:methyl-accepting chemotaxis protein [Enterococcus italicus]